MKIKRSIVWLGALFLVLLGVNSAFSADEDILKGPPATEVNAEPETQWVWGEIVLLDPVNKKINIKYLDYDTDTEKELSIVAGEGVVFDNFNSLEQLKPGDNISVDYIVNADGVNFAKNISIEKPEGALPPNEYVPSVVNPDLNLTPKTQPEIPQAPLPGAGGGVDNTEGQSK